MNKLIGAILLTTTAILWGISFLFTKAAVVNVTPSIIAFLRFAIALIILLPFKVKSGKKLEKKEKLYSMIAGACGVTLYFLFENNALKITSASEVSLIVSTAPILTLLFYDIKSKRFDMSEYLGAFFALIGIGFVIFNGFFSIASSFLGNILALLSACTWVFYTFYFEKIHNKFIAANFELIKWGTIFLIPFCIFDLVRGEKVNINSDVIWSILFLGVLCSALGYIMWGNGIKLFGGKTANLWIYTIPIFTFIAEIFVFKTKPGIFFLIGCLFVFAGIIIVFKRESVKRKNRIEIERDIKSP